MFKFCQHYDENLDTYVGGCSICDFISCLLTCGLILREKEQDGSQDEQDFRKRFEKSLDKHNADVTGSGGGERKKRERVGKDIKNYISQSAKIKVYGEGENEDDPFQNQNQPKRGKCHQFCCIVFCCMDANVYYGEERYQRMMVKATEDNVVGASHQKAPAAEYEDLQEG